MGWVDTTLQSGAKAMLLVSKDQGPALMVMPATGRLSWKKAKAALPGTKKSDWRLATEEEVFDITGGCVPGSVPPFGSAFARQGVPTFVDTGLFEVPFINFNCGLRTRSMRITVEDYVRAEQPKSIEMIEA